MTQNVRSKKIYSTLAAVAFAAIIASVPVTAEATSYLDITSQYVGSLDNGATFTGVAQQYSLIGGATAGSIAYGYFSLGTSGLFIGSDLDNDPSTAMISMLTGDSVLLLSSDTSNQFAASYTFSFRTTGGSLETYIPHNSWGTIEIAGVDLTETDPSYFFGTADTKAPAPVPEPATMSLLLAGGSALVGLRRRRNSTAK